MRTTNRVSEMALRIITNTAVARFKALTGEQRRAVMAQLVQDCCPTCWEDRHTCQCYKGVVKTLDGTTWTRLSALVERATEGDASAAQQLPAAATQFLTTER